MLSQVDSCTHHLTLVQFRNPQQDFYFSILPYWGHYSWWDYRAAAFPRNNGWRIDHHYLSPPLYEQAKNCTIDIAPRKLVKPSDHTPVIVEI